VLTGVGESWCAARTSGSIFAPRRTIRRSGRDPTPQVNRWRWEKLKTFPKPTIAMVNGYCYGAAFTQLCAVDFVITAQDALYGLSEVNWGNHSGRDRELEPDGYDPAAPRSLLRGDGEAFDGKRAVEIGSPISRCRRSGCAMKPFKFASKLMKLNPGVVRATKEAMRAVRGMSDDQARDYLRSKQDSLMRNDGEIRDQVGMKQFLDEKSYRPGLGP